jgi:hypothetical protein
MVVILDMRPRQKLHQRSSAAALKKGAITRSQNAGNSNKSDAQESDVSKRKADGSPANDKTFKRSAFGDITNVSNTLPNINI